MFVHRIAVLTFTMGAALVLSGCETMQAGNDAEHNPYDATGTDPYNAYNTGGTAVGGQGTGGYVQPAAGTYTQPAYNQTPTNPYAGGYADTGYGNTPAQAYPQAAYGGGGGRSHRIVAGDTLSGISRRYGVSVEQLMRANNLPDDRIYIGNNLSIP